VERKKVTRIDLARLSLIRPVLVSRWPQLILRTLTLAGFVFAILAGLAGTPVGSRNFGIVFVWIAWWALLIVIAIPFFGRGWCSVCPIPMPGEWLQQGAVLGPLAGAGRGLGRRWPNKWRNIWLQNIAFALIALFSTVVLTQPRISALVLAGFLLVATGASLVYERRAFCRYLCPVGGFIGLYSQLAPIELRVKDSQVCAGHTQKTCYTGSAEGYGCPWQVFPGGLVKNTYCGTCMECLRTCPHDNIALNLRSFGSDLLHPAGRKLDEAFKAFIMLGSALVYSAVLLGPWGVLKTSAYAVGSPSWLIYALVFLFFVFGALPGLFYVAVGAGRMLARLARDSQDLAPVSQKLKGAWNRQALKKLFVAFAYSLVPLGLAAWIAFSLSFVFANASYVLPSLSDPLGWGWNLFGTAGFEWTPLLTRITSLLQVTVLLGGLAWASRTAQRIAGQQTVLEGLPSRAVDRQALPVMLYCLLVTVVLLVLLVA
jgi:hypothetical protein